MPSIDETGLGVFAIVIAIGAFLLIVAWLLPPILILSAIRQLRDDANAHLTGLQKAAELNANLLSEIAKASQAIDRCSNELLDAIETTHELDAQTHELDTKVYQRLKNLEELTAHTHRLLEWLGKQPHISAGETSPSKAEA